MQWADFPFSAVGEQFGLIGCAVVLGLFAVVLLRIWRIAHLSRDMLGTYLCAGVFTMLLWQVVPERGHDDRASCRSPACRCRSSPTAGRAW